MARWTRLAKLAATIVCAGGVGMTGCGKPAAISNAAEAVAEQSAANPAAVAAGDGPREAHVTVEKPAAISVDRLHQTFAQATRQANDPPAGSERPVDQTMAGKSTGKIYTDVVRLWNEIRFTTADGKPIAYAASIETNLGTVEMQLFPEVAPNHVRNFVALAKAGYYDGLCFDRVHHEEDEGNAATRLDELEAGCPLGTGEPGLDHIGYWLNPEFDDPKQPKASHEVGTVGACRGDELDSAACRFYITLSKAPYLDGNYTAFGKVTQGLDVARTIFQRPIILDDRDVNGSRRPENPVVIRKIAIHTK